MTNRVFHQIKDSPTVVEHEVTRRRITTLEKDLGNTLAHEMKNQFTHQSCFPAPLPVSWVVSESPQVPVGFDDFWTEDVILLSLPDCHRLYCTIKLEGLGT